MAGEEQEGVRRWGARVAGALATLPVVYVLSIGPVAGWWCEMRRNAGDLSDEQFKSLKSFYSPLIFMHDHCQPIGNALEWYVDLWE